jgi:hypothetical protein
MSIVMFWLAVNLDEDIKGFPVSRQYIDRDAAEAALQDARRDLSDAYLVEREAAPPAA